MSRRSSCLPLLALVAVQLMLAVSAVSAVSAESIQLSTGQPSRRLLCACPRIYLPVCGSDGKQYPNRCTAECAGVFVTETNPQFAGQCSRMAVDPLGPTGPGDRAPQLPVPTNGDSSSSNSGSGSGNIRPFTGGSGSGLPSRPLNLNTMNSMSNNGGAGSGCRCPKIYMPVCGAFARTFAPYRDYWIVH